jgi:hypothetical protein
VIPGSNQHDRADFFIQEHFPTIERVFQRIAGFLFQKDPLTHRLTGTLPEEVTLPNGRIDSNQKKVAGLMLPVEFHPLFDPPPTAGQNHDCIGFHLTRAQGEGFVGEIDKKDGKRQQNYESQREEAFDESHFFSKREFFLAPKNSLCYKLTLQINQEDIHHVKDMRNMRQRPELREQREPRQQ